jgi:hypothetical protein
MEPSHEETADTLAFRANLARSRLAATLSALDRRRREVFNVPLQVTKHLGIVAAVVAIGVTGVVALGVYRAATAQRRRRYERWRMVRRVWTHPERAAPREPSLLGSLARTLLLGAARAIATRVLVGLAQDANAHTASPRTMT